MQHQGHEQPPTDPVASLAVTASKGQTKAVVLVLHGGKAVSREATMSTHASVLRMVPFARAVHRRTRRDSVAVWRLRYRYRGWNGAEASPVTDARWALDEVRRQHGDVPVVILGHSMGGRTAARVATDPSVCGLVLLAPWMPPGEPVSVKPGLQVCVIHGDQDVITSADTSAAWSEHADRAGADVSYHLLAGGEHFMLRHLPEWHRLAADAVVRSLVGCEVMAAR